MIASFSARALLALFLVAGLWAGTEAAEKARFATHFKANPYYGLPAVAALDKGFWKEQGLEVNWLPFDSATTMVQALAAAGVDMGTHGLDSVILAVARGLPEVIVADPKMKADNFLWVLSGSDIKQPAHLRAAKVGVSRFGVLTHRLGEVAFRNLGVAKEVRFVALGGATPMVAALKARKVDGVIFTFFSVAPLKAKGEIRDVLNLNDYVPEGPGQQILFAHTGFLQGKREAVRMVIRGFLQGATFLMKDRGWTIEKLKADYGYSQEAAEVVFPMLRYGTEGSISLKKLEAVAKFLVESGLLAKEKVPPLDKLFVQGLVD